MPCAALKNCVSINSFCILGMLICFQSLLFRKNKNQEYLAPSECQKCWVKTRAGRIKIRPDRSRSGSKLFAKVISRLQKCISIGYSAGVDLLLIVTPIVGFCNCSMFCCTLLYVHSSFAALLSLPSWCLVIVVWLCLAVPWVCLQFVIVVFPDHTHLLFL